MRRTLRTLSTVLIVAGALLLADAALTLLWQEPVSALYGRVQQDKLEGRLADIEKAPLAAVDQRALRRLDAGRRLAFAARALKRARDKRLPLAVVMGDIDRFKAINDSAGHLAGDAVLVEIARRLRGQLRGKALLGRLGGDEFAAVLPECDVATAREIVQRAVAAVGGEAIGALAQVTISAGIAQRAPRDASSEDLYQRADTELYRAKDHRAPAQLAVWRDSSAA